MKTVISEFNRGVDDFHFHHTLSPKGEYNLAKLGTESHQQFEILYLIKGEIKYLIEGEEYVVNEGDVIFVSPNQIHSIDVSPQKDYERIVVMFDLETVEKMLALGGMSLNKDVFSDTSCYRVIPHTILQKTGIIKRLLSFSDYKKHSLGHIFMLTGILNLIMELDSVFSEFEKGYAPVRVDNVVKSAVSYINKNICNPLTLNEICAHLFVSKSTLCHRFVKTMRISVNRYVAIKKIHHASRLIRQGMGAVEAGLAVGYKQYTTFYHNYKQIMGVSPTDNKQNV